MLPLPGFPLPLYAGHAPESAISTRTFILGDLSVFAPTASMPAPTSGSFSLVERDGSGAGLDIAVTPELTLALRYTMGEFCLNPQSDDCLRQVQDLLDVTDLGQQFNNLTTRAIGLTKPWMKLSKPVGLIGAITGILYYLWQRTHPSSPALSNPIFTVHVPDDHLSEAASWSPGDKVVFKTAQDDKAPVTVTLKDYPAATTAVKTCKKNPNCREDEHRPDCETCDGNMNSTCTSGECQECKCTWLSDPKVNELNRTELYLVPDMLQRWVNGAFDPKTYLHCDGDEKAELPQEKFEVQDFCDGQSLDTPFENTLKADDKDVHFRWAPFLRGKADCGYMDCAMIFSSFLYYPDCASTDNKTMNVKGERGTICGQAKYEIRDSKPQITAPPTPSYTAPSATTCNPGNYGKPRYTKCGDDIWPQYVTSAASAFCAQYSGTTISADAPTKTLESAYSGKYSANYCLLTWGVYMFHKFTVSWIDGCKAVPGVIIQSGDDCRGALIQAWSQCDNDGNGGMYETDCVRIDFSPKCR